MPGRVLIVDDLPSNRMLLRARLTAAFYDVIEAEDGRQGLARARADHPDLILLDVVMPGLDGFATCEALKADPETHHIPVVMITAHGERAVRVQGLEAGADDFLSRTVDAAALMSRVNNLIRMKMMIDELRLRSQTARSLGLGPLGLDDGFDPADASLLLISDDPDFTAEARRRLSDHLGTAIAQVEGAGAVASLLRTNRYDAFLIGASLSDGEPLRLASMLRARPETRQAALMMVLGAAQEGQIATAMDIGVSDTVTTPVDYAEMAARLRVQLRRKHYSDRLRHTLSDGMRLAATDPLTGLYNRRYAHPHLDALVVRAAQEGTPLAVMLLDLDRFKAINDGYGHAAGDAVLVDFARRLSANTRGLDLVCRMGGEEFLVAMPDIKAEIAERVAERVRFTVEEPEFEIPAPPGRVAVTVSIGLALLRPGEDAAALLARADAALYRSKAGGRNRVTLAAA